MMSVMYNNNNHFKEQSTSLYNNIINEFDSDFILSSLPPLAPTR